MMSEIKNVKKYLNDLQNIFFKQNYQLFFLFRKFKDSTCSLEKKKKKSIGFLLPQIID